MMTRTDMTNRLHRVLRAADARREHRAEDRPTQTFRFDREAEVIRAKVPGECEGQVYDTSLPMGPMDWGAWRCTCRDAENRNGSMAPCKHAISVAQAALDALEKAS